MNPFAILTFLGSPVGKIVAIALGVLSAVVYIDRRATFRERGKCNAEKVQSQLNAAKADLDNAKKARADDQSKITKLETENKTAEAENAKLAEEIAKLPKADQCIIPPGRSKRM